MSVKLLGRCLIRRAKMTNGQEVLLLCGAFLPQGTPVDSFDDRDEMWITEFELSDKSIRFINTQNHQFSPEDFLENVNDIQKSEMWTHKL